MYKNNQEALLPEVEIFKIPTSIQHFKGKSLIENGF
jgi:hypothetical protein